jgi:hypothetical protein
MNDRTEALRDLAELRAPVASAVARVVAFPLHADQELFQLGSEHVVAVLQRFLGGALTAREVATWAEALEMREDVGYPSQVGEALFVLSSPEINGPLTPRLATELVTKYGGRPVDRSS